MAEIKHNQSKTTEPSDADRLDALDKAFTIASRAMLINQGPYMSGKNMGFSTAQFGPRTKRNFRSVREVADFIILKNKQEDAS